MAAGIRLLEPAPGTRIGTGNPLHVRWDVAPWAAADGVSMSVSWDGGGSWQQLRRGSASSDAHFPERPPRWGFLLFGQPVDRLPVCDIDLVERKGVMAQQTIAPGVLQGDIVIVVEVIDTDDPLTLSEQRFRNMISDEACGSGDENSHANNPYLNECGLIYRVRGGNSPANS